MDLGQNINQSIEYTKKLFSDFGRLVILIILDIIPIVNLIVAGYMARVIRETPSVDSPPKLENYGNMWIDGLKIAVASLIYMIIPMILIILGGMSLFASFMIPIQGSGFQKIPFGFIPAGLGAMFFGIGIIFAFLVAIILAMAIVHMIKTDNFGKAFAVSEILGIIGKIRWGSYIVWLIVIFIFAVIVGAIGAIPVIGWLISLVISPIFGVFAARSAALTYTSSESPTVTTAPTAPTGAPSGKKFCISCGAEIPDEATFCPGCGKPQ
ncbi:hypothetical protein A3K80_01730 [Candidatus Bathyarchaeota archaeon RBG_13_38_9]|nr:MAG: hypothetical protein A3K80_01730 [Candidatus Bathyarchaeota archaeon RBG_13_38_9]